MVDTVTETAQDRQTTVSGPVACGRRAKGARRAARLCLACGRRRALFRFRGTVRADRDHNLCFECFRAEANRLRSCRMGAGVTLVPLASARPAPSKTVADRAGLLLELQTRRRRAQMMARRALDAGDPSAVPGGAAALAS